MYTGNDTRIKTKDELITYCKNLRDFNSTIVLSKKVKAINQFFEEEGLDTAVVGLSGGIDSSVVYYLLLYAANVYGSPIKRVVGAFMSIKTDGITGQDDAEKYFLELVDDVPEYILQNRVDFPISIDLTKTAEAYFKALLPSNDWVRGQIGSIVRTPALYGLAAKQQYYGYKSIVVGTTNRDEGAYIGFFGKASDGMVDLQPIADLHKSEVYELAKLLNVPNSIINRIPKGDVWDNKNDEEMIGASYDVLEMYLTLLDNNATYLISYVKDCSDLNKWILNIEIQRQKNLHKYKVGPPARYVDVMENKKYLIQT